MPTKLQVVRESFFTTVFSLLGHIANCDGFINRNEIKRIETYMDKMGLSEKCRREAKHLFKEGTRPQFNLHQVLAEFNKTSTPNLVQILLVYLITMARTDGQLVQKELNVVQQVATELGYKSIVFDHLLKMIAAQDEFASPAEPHKTTQHQTNSQAKQKFEDYLSKNPGTNKQSNNEQKKRGQSQNKSDKKPGNKPGDSQRGIEDAYEALGANDSMSEAEVRRVYQRLVSQFHPDKLVGQGMPPDLVNTATERFKRIQAAYEHIKKYRHVSEHYRDEVNVY